MASPSSPPIDEKSKLESSAASVTTETFVEGSEGVTHEELSALRHLPDAIPFSAFLVVVVEFAERWTYYGEFCSVTSTDVFESPTLTRCRSQRRSVCGEITSVLNFRPVRPLVPSPPPTGPMVLQEPLGVVCRLHSRSVTSTFSGSTLLPSWAALSRTVT